MSRLQNKLGRVVTACVREENSVVVGIKCTRSCDLIYELCNRRRRFPIVTEALINKHTIVPDIPHRCDLDGSEKVLPGCLTLLLPRYPRRDVHNFVLWVYKESTVPVVVDYRDLIAILESQFYFLKA